MRTILRDVTFILAGLCFIGAAAFVWWDGVPRKTMAITCEQIVKDLKGRDAIAGSDVIGCEAVEVK